ncbi:MAG: hypothetical protein K2K04_03375 [Clostridia bacterium]|nr:hypothetical protein [Clostridia bacterium]
MKKFITALCMFLLLPIVVAVAGCNNLSEGDDWKEVQSITYTTDKDTTTLTSECVWEYERVEIEKSEYDSAPDNQKRFGSGIFSTSSLDIDRKTFIKSTNGMVGKTYYYSYHTGDYDHPTSFFCYKVTVNSYTLSYVKIKFVSDSVLEIDFKGEQKRVNTLSYDVTYFKN